MKSQLFFDVNCLTNRQSVESGGSQTTYQYTYSFDRRGRETVTSTCLSCTQTKTCRRVEPVTS